MGWVNLTLANFAVDQAATSQDMLEFINNQIAVKEFTKTFHLGGDPKTFYETSGYVDVIDPIFCEVDATNLGGLTFHLQYMGKASSGDTIEVQLYDEEEAEEVFSTSFNDTVLNNQVSTSFAIEARLNTLKIRVRAASSLQQFQAYGFQLVQI